MPRTSTSEPSFCPMCGSKNIQIIDKPIDDYWESMGETMGVPGAIVRELYELWDIKEYANFREFVKAMIREHNHEIAS